MVRGLAVSRAAKPLGLRREVLFFLPTAIFLLVVIASFDLLVYRNAVRDIQAERLAEATSLAAKTAALLAAGSVSSGERLERLAPGATAVAVRGRDGRIVSRSGTPMDIDLTLLSGSPHPVRPAAYGPQETAAPVISAVAPFERDGRPLYLQLDFGAERLAAHVNTLGRILLLNAAVLGSLTLLVLLFLRHLLAPYDSLLERARRLGGAAEIGDETEFLVKTFERALEALGRRDDDGGDDIAVIERTLAPSLESGFLLLDPHGTVLSLNETGATLLGIEQPPPGTSLESLLPGEEEFTTLIGTAIDGGSLGQRQQCGIGPPAQRRVLGLTVHPLRRDDGAVRGFIVLFADLTQVQARARQDQISRNLSQLGEIAAGVAHEMRNGLGTLKGYLTLIDQSPDEESARDYLEEMRSESAHLERVLTDFLSFARPGSLRSERLDLADLAARTTADPALAEADFDLVSADQSLKLTGDRQLLERALRNLLQNAVEAQRAKGSAAPITVRLDRDGDFAQVEILDAGPGLPEDLRESLFQPFVSGRPDGVGLGLALAHRIAELHEGSLELEDRASGGVRARLLLPVTIDT